MLVYTGRPARYTVSQLRWVPRGPQGRTLKGLGAINYPTIDAAIKKFEGYFPGSIAYRNNNPGNLVYAPWQAQYGCSPGGAGGFAQCPTAEAGEAILDYRVSQLVGLGNSLAELLRVWAGPQYPGNTQQSYDAYVASVAADTGFDPGVSVLSQAGGAAAALAGSQVAIPADSASDLEYLFANSAGSGPNWGVVLAAGLGAVALLYAMS